MIKKNDETVSFLNENKIKILKNIYLYENLNKFIISNVIMEGKIWVPKSKSFELSERLKYLE